MVVVEEEFVSAAVKGEIETKAVEVQAKPKAVAA